MMNEAFKFIFKTIGYKLSGRMHAPTDKIGKNFINSNGQKFVIFKQTVLDPLLVENKEPQAMFRVQFKVAKLVPWRDRLIISLKSPIFVALPGFRSKIWMVDKKNSTYQGVYEWDSLENAKDYVHSASMDFMKEIAVSGGLSYEIIPNGKLKEIDSGLSLIGTALKSI